MLAGPGSGKTRVITRRVAHLVASGCRPDDILAITFTNKAAGEMRERIEALGVPPGVWVSTFHAFCARMLRIYADRVGLSRSFTIYDSADSVAAVKRAMAELQLDTTLFTPSYAARVISTAKNRLWGPEKLQESGAPEEAFAIGKVFERYERLLRGANAADFDDLLILMVRLLRDVPETRERLGRRFLHVLVDEYQDTNHAQYLIAKHLAGAGNLCVTGDPDQSIYGWRGADVNNILEFERDYPDARIVRLEQNYRSTQRILQAADRLIAHNVQRKAKSLWTENPEGEPVRLLRLRRRAGRGRRRRRRPGRALPRRARASRATSAVFYRLNSQSRVLESALRGEAIPYSIVAGTEFYQRREIKDLLSYLRLVDNPADDVGVERVANIPARRIGDTSLQRLREWGSAHGLTLFEALAKAAEAGVRGPALQGIAEFRRLIDQLRALPRRPVAAVLERLLADTALRALPGLRRRQRGGAHRERARTRQRRRRVRPGRAGRRPAGVPRAGRARLRRGPVGREARRRHADDAPRGEGTRVPGRLHRRPRGRPAAAAARERRPRPRGGTAAVLRRPDARQAAADAELRRVARPPRQARIHAALALHRGAARGDRRSRTIRVRARRSFPSAFIDPSSASRNRQSAIGNRQFFAEPRRVRRSEHEEIVYDGDYSSDAAMLDPRAPFRAGDSVRHPRYGVGRVMDVSGYGEDLRATVRFQTVGVKRLVLKFAGLRKL